MFQTDKNTVQTITVEAIQMKTLAILLPLLIVFGCATHNAENAFEAGFYQGFIDGVTYTSNEAKKGKGGRTDKEITQDAVKHAKERFEENLPYWRMGIIRKGNFRYPDNE